MSMRRAFLVAPALHAVFATSAAAHSSALGDAGTNARLTTALWWQMFSVLAVVYVIVVAAIAVAVLRRGREATIIRDSSMTFTVAITTGLTAAILVGFLIASHATDAHIDELAGVPPTRIIKVTGHQWWWEIEYPDKDASRTVTTANELHLPVNEAVRLDLTSQDVIHSFWVPDLAGKLDLIPGRGNELLLRAEKEGEYRGQCAEFCGMQHAHMGLVVVAESPARYEAWLAAQRASAVPPSSDLEKRGNQIFVTGPCALCHTVRGTSASARSGPDLTHLASRRLLAAGVLERTPENLERWITDSQSIKPGNAMPPVSMTASDLDALVAWLETLR